MSAWNPVVITSDEDVEELFVAVARVWWPHADPRRAARRLRWRWGQTADHLAYLGQAGGEGMLGGAQLQRRALRFGPARVEVALLRQLVVDADHRDQGLEQALCERAAEVAAEAGCPLLLVRLRPGWSAESGFVRIHDPLVVGWPMEQGRALPPRPERVRPVGLHDLAEFEALWTEYFAPHLGASWDDAADLRGKLNGLLPLNPPVFALDEAGAVRGCFVPGAGWPRGPQAVVALDAEAIRDLRAFHAHRTGAWGATEELRWVVPADSPTVAAAQELGATVEREDDPTTGPAARLTDRARLLADLEPLFTERAGDLRPDFAQASDADLCQLAFAYRPPADLGLNDPAWAACFPPATAWLGDLVGR